jgi:hypothetical protein
LGFRFLGVFYFRKISTGGRRVFSLAFVVEFDRKGFSMLPNQQGDLIIEPHEDKKERKKYYDNHVKVVVSLSFFLYHHHADIYRFNFFVFVNDFKRKVPEVMVDRIRNPKTRQPEDRSTTQTEAQSRVPSLAQRMHDVSVPVYRNKHQSKRACQDPGHLTHRQETTQEIT